MSWPDSVIRNLVGSDILSIEIDKSSLVISLSGERKIEIFSDITIEPWTIQAPEITYTPNLDLPNLGIDE